MRSICYSFIIIFSILNLLSCDIPLSFEGDTRYHAKGKVVNNTGQPILDIWVQIKACRGPGNCSLAGYGKTDKNGHFSFIHSGSNATSYRLLINFDIIDKIAVISNRNFKKKNVTFLIEDYKNYQNDWGDIEI